MIKLFFVAAHYQTWTRSLSSMTFIILATPQPEILHAIITFFTRP